MKIVCEINFYYFVWFCLVKSFKDPLLKACRSRVYKMGVGVWWVNFICIILVSKFSSWLLTVIFKSVGNKNIFWTSYTYCSHLHVLSDDQILCYSHKIFMFWQTKRIFAFLAMLSIFLRCLKFHVTINKIKIKINFLGCLLHRVSLLSPLVVILYRSGM